MSLRLCYIPYIYRHGYDTVEVFKARLNEDDHYGVITVREHSHSAAFLEMLASAGLDKGLVYKSTEAVSYRYPDLGPRLTLRVYSFKGLL
jgi:hypothetical protein